MPLTLQIVKLLVYRVPNVDYRKRIILWPTTHKFEYYLIMFQFGIHVSLFVPGFDQLVFVSRLDKYNRICDTIKSLFLQSNKIPIQMYSSTRGEVSEDNLIRMA